MQRRVVAVFGSGTEHHGDLAEPLGRWLASQPVHLLTGAGGGVMEAVARGFVSVPGRAGLSLGIVPGPRCPPGYPNAYVEIPIRTHLGQRGKAGGALDSRNHINVLSADVAVALPGGEGTLTEIALAERYETPMVIWRREGEAGEVRADQRTVTRLADVQSFVSTQLSLLAAG